MATREDPAVREGTEPSLHGFSGQGLSRQEFSPQSEGASTAEHPPLSTRPAKAEEPSPPGTGLRHIVVCLDRSSAGEAALPFGFALAGTSNAQVTLLHVLRPDPDKTTGALEWEISRIEARQYLEGIRAQAQKDGFDARTAVVQGDPAQQIVQFAWETHADLVVLASHGKRGENDWALGGTALKILTRSQTSALIVPRGGREYTEEPSIRFRRIMAALDCSVRSECVLPTAERLAQNHGAELVLTHVVPKPELTLPAPATEDDIEMVDRLHRRNRRVAERYLSQLSARLAGRGFRVNLILESRDSGARALERIAEREEIDLMVLSAHGNAGSPDRLYGSVIQHLLSDPSTPLLILQDLARDEIRRLTETRFVRKAPRQVTIPRSENRL
jgi:nucleotide-binding universal stress UspA family protein